MATAGYRKVVGLQAREQNELAARCQFSKRCTNQAFPEVGFRKSNGLMNETADNLVDNERGEISKAGHIDNLE
jgi:hypothetical protein